MEVRLNPAIFLLACGFKSSTAQRNNSSEGSKQDSFQQLHNRIVGYEMNIMGLEWCLQFKIEYFKKKELLLVFWDRPITQAVNRQISMDACTHIA